MARAADLMGLGFAWPLAARLGEDSVSAIAAGAAVGSATQLGGQPTIFFVNATAQASSGVKLPQVGGDNGCLIGDEIIVMNLLSATIAVYASTNNAGSAMQFFVNSTSATGSTGMSLISGAMMTLRPITPSTWVGIKTSV